MISVECLELRGCAVDRDAWMVVPGHPGQRSMVALASLERIIVVANVKLKRRVRWHIGYSISWMDCMNKVVSLFRGRR